jgi:hypothetical protein
VTPCQICGLCEAECSDGLCQECAYERYLDDLLEQQTLTGYFGQPMTCEELGEL